MRHKIYTLDKGNCYNNEKSEYWENCNKPENISISSGNGGADAGTTGVLSVQHLST